MEVVSDPAMNKSVRVDARFSIPAFPKKLELGSFVFSISVKYLSMKSLGSF